MSYTSTRLGIQVPTGEDQANIPGNLATIVNAMDGGDATTSASSGTAWYSQSATDPGHKNGGHLWWCTDTTSANYGLNYYEYTGPSASTNGWRNIGPDVVIETSTPTGSLVSDKVVWVNPNTGFVKVYDAATTSWKPITSVDWRSVPASNGMIPTVGTSGAVTYKTYSSVGGGVGNMLLSGASATAITAGSTVEFSNSIQLTGATAYVFNIHGRVSTAGTAGVIYGAVKITPSGGSALYYPGSTTAVLPGNATFQNSYVVGVTGALSLIHGTIVVTGLTAATTYTCTFAIKPEQGISVNNLAFTANPVALATLS